MAGNDSTGSTLEKTEPAIHPLFEPVTGTWQYIVADPTSKSAVIIDPVLDYDPVKAIVSTDSADAMVKTIRDMRYKVDMILETHAHADHLTAASYLQSILANSQGSKPLIGIGSRIRQVQSLFGERYGISPEEYQTVFDRLWEDNDEFKIGTLTARAVHLPGHTPDHMGYHVGNNVFVGDSIFHVDIGSARADFPGGSAEAIFNSGRKLLALPGETKIWVGHDYPPPGRDAPVPFATVQEHRMNNKHLKDGTLEEEFVDMRHKRDETLAAPRLIHPSLQVNIRGGRQPAPLASGHRMVHLPLTGPSW
ncbi:Ff.00g016280.m01.CDS01 [Fusarium sp. VM40]|nr:Ff.00g016280.m01.CDS01 [Fusarium sp. VM40]